MERTKASRKITLLLLWNVMLTVAVLGLWIGRWGDAASEEWLRAAVPGSTVTDEGLSLFVSQGAVVVTHLYAEVGDSTRIARLPEPFVSFDSGHLEMDRGRVEALSWRDLRGEKASAPPVGTTVRAIYYQSHASQAPEGSGP